MTWLRRMRDGWQAEISAKAQKRFPSLPVTCRMPYLLGWRNLWSIWTLLRLTVGLFFAELLNWQTWRKHEENIEEWNEIFFPKSFEDSQFSTFTEVLSSSQHPLPPFPVATWVRTLCIGTKASSVLNTIILLPRCTCVLPHKEFWHVCCGCTSLKVRNIFLVLLLS